MNMTIAEVMQFILLPCVGWLLLNTNKNANRLSRIETQLELLLDGHITIHKNERKPDR